MTPYAVSENDIPPELFRLFKVMRDHLEHIPDFEGEVLTCHAVCTAFARHYNGIQCVDGTFADFFDHSWLIHKGSPQVIMDMYPVAGASPFIVFINVHFLPWKKLYTPKSINYDKVQLERQVQKILSITNQ